MKEFIATEEDVKRILALREQGMNKHDIALIMHTSAQKINQILMANGMSKPLKSGPKLTTGVDKVEIEEFSLDIVEKEGIDPKWADLIDPNNPANIGLEGEEGVDWFWATDIKGFRIKSLM